MTPPALALLAGGRPAEVPAGPVLPLVLESFLQSSGSFTLPESAEVGVEVS